MAGLSRKKRKQDQVTDSPITQLSTKRRKTGSSAASTAPVSTSQSQENAETENVYSVRRILKEKGNKYLIDWEDDINTGEKYAPTWEPKENANDLLRSVWEASKALQNQASSKRKRGRPRKHPVQTGFVTKASPGLKRPRGRPRQTPPILEEVLQVQSPKIAPSKLREDDADSVKRTFPDFQVGHRHGQAYRFSKTSASATVSSQRLNSVVPRSPLAKLSYKEHQEPSSASVTRSESPTPQGQSQTAIPLPHSTSSSDHSPRLDCSEGERVIPDSQDLSRSVSSVRLVNSNHTSIGSAPNEQASYVESRPCSQEEVIRRENYHTVSPGCSLVPGTPEESLNPWTGCSSEKELGKIDPSLRSKALTDHEEISETTLAKLPISLGGKATQEAHLIKSKTLAAETDTESSAQKPSANLQAAQTQGTPEPGRVEPSQINRSVQTGSHLQEVSIISEPDAQGTQSSSNQVCLTRAESHPCGVEEVVRTKTNIQEVASGSVAATPNACFSLRDSPQGAHQSFHFHTASPDNVNTGSKKSNRFRSQLLEPSALVDKNLASTSGDTAAQTAVQPGQTVQNHLVVASEGTLSTRLGVISERSPSIDSQETISEKGELESPTNEAFQVRNNLEAQGGAEKLFVEDRLTGTATLSQGKNSSRGETNIEANLSDVQFGRSSGAVTSKRIEDVPSFTSIKDILGPIPSSADQLEIAAATEDDEEPDLDSSQSAEDTIAVQHPDCIQVVPVTQVPLQETATRTLAKEDTSTCEGHRERSAVDVIHIRTPAIEDESISSESQRIKDTAAGVEASSKIRSPLKVFHQHYPRTKNIQRHKNHADLSGTNNSASPPRTPLRRVCSLSPNDRGLSLSVGSTGSCRIPSRASVNGARSPLSLSGSRDHLNRDSLKSNKNKPLLDSPFPRSRKFIAMSTPIRSVESLQDQQPIVTPDSSKLTMREKLRGLRQSSEADILRTKRPSLEGLVSRGSNESPSVIPATLTHPSMPMSARLPSLGLDKRDFPDIRINDPLTESGSSLQSIMLSEPRLGISEFIVAIPLNGSNCDLYRKCVLERRSLIEEFTQKEWEEDSPILKNVQELLQSLHNVTTHVDLADPGTATQAQVSPKDQAVWDRTCSSKFLFLHHFLDHVRSLNKHIVIAAKPGRLLSILQIFLEGNRITYVRPDSNSHKTVPDCALQVTVLPTIGEAPRALVERADLIIALDHSFTVDDYIQGIRTDLANSNQVSPVIRLVVVNSPEHIELCIAKDAKMREAEWLRILVSCTAQLRRDVGQLPSDFPWPVDAAEAVATFMRGGDWPLPPLEGFDASFAESQSQSLKVAAGQGAAEVQTQKRAIELDDDSEPTKRVRLTPQPAASPSDQMKPKPEITYDDTAAKELIRLRELHEEKEAILQEHISALTDLQFRFESQSAEIRSICRERDEAVRLQTTGQARAQNRIESQATTIAALKAECAKLRESLEQVRQNPEIVPQMVQSEALNQMESEKQKVEQKLRRLEEDFNFLRTQYQEASGAGAELASQNKQLTAELEEANRKASGEAAKLRQMHMDSVTEALNERCAMLELMVREREKLLRQKEEELKVLRSRSAMGTRSSSLPGSPKLGANAGSGASSPEIGGQSSKGLMHPLRNS